MKPIKYVLLTVLVITQIANAAEPFAFPAPDAQLRKASMRSRGYPATPEERVEVRSKGNTPEAVEAMIGEYTHSLEFNKIMLRRVFELLKITEDKTGVVENIVQEVINLGRPWDDIFIDDTFTFSTESDDDGRYNNDAEYSAEMSVASYYEFINKTKLKEDNYELAPTKSQAENIAGIFSTPAFSIRYRTTKLNKNRTRGAALFRILLCDEMKQAVDLSGDSEKQALMFSLGAKSTAQMLAPVVDAHGANPSCQSCHQKIDPAGRTFVGSSVTLSPKASPGALVYINSQKQKIAIPVTSLKRFVQAVQQQPEYTQCQIRRFWNWFIGEDVPLTSQMESQLVIAFNSFQIGRQPGKFAQFLMTLPAFRNGSALPPNDIRFANVKPIFKRCDSCHSGEPLAPSLTKYPFSSSFNENEKQVLEIVKDTNLFGHERKSVMPPRRAGWNLAKSEIDLLKLWVAGGAKDDNGQVRMSAPTISRFERESLPNAKSATALIPSFDNTYLRFADVSMIQNYMGQSSCGNAIADRFKFNPETGRPLLRAPTPEFFDFLGNCVSLISSKVSLWRLVSTYGEEALSGMHTSWVLMKPNDRHLLAWYVYDYMIGARAYPLQRVLETVEKAKQSIPRDFNTGDGVEQLARFIALTPDFLIY